MEQGAGSHALFRISNVELRIARNRSEKDGNGSQFRPEGDDASCRLKERLALGPWLFALQTTAVAQQLYGQSHRAARRTVPAAVADAGFLAEVFDADDVIGHNG